MDLPLAGAFTDDDPTIEIVPGCGHWIPAERPDLVAERVLSPA
jgi:pimeloyl-ACP methyl ester carboxylesterase